MKKIVTIPDTHGKGKEYWGDKVQEVINDKYDLGVFLGDYVDCFYTPNNVIFDNLKEIINLKKKYPNKFILLFGNHCIQYALVPGHVSNPYSCSGYRGDMHIDLHELFKKNIDLFQLAYQYKNYLWTHAGIHQGWWDFDYPYHKDDLSDIADQLNKSFEKREPSIFQVGKIRGGYKDVGGPLWADRRITSNKPLKGLHQIVGHSRIDDIKHFDKYADKDTSITFCDCLDENSNFYKIEINE